MMRILVTGGAGFIGSHLVDRLVQDRAGEIVVFDNLARGRWENLAAHRDDPCVRLVQGDIRDAARLAEEMSGTEIVYHLAAQSNVLGAVSDVGYSFETNVAGTFNVLRSAHACGVRRVVFTSSREAYGEAQYLPVDEDHPLLSKNTYGASKLAGEAYARVFHNVYQLETAVLRLGNVYGPRDFDRVIPIWLTRALRGQDLVVYGGAQLIDFVWIDSVVEALIRASEADIIGRPVNVASGVGTPILGLADRILGLAGSQAKLDRQPARSVEVAKFTADVTRMRRLLHLDPPTDPLFALPQLVEYYRGPAHA